MKFYHILFVILLVQMFHFTRGIRTPVLHIEQRLRDYLFQNYSRDIRPVHNVSKAINVSVCPEIVQIIDVDERHQSMKLKIWVRMQWANELLKWDPEEWSGIDTLKVKPDLVWTPDIVILNQVQNDIVDNTDEYKTMNDSHIPRRVYVLGNVSGHNNCVFY